MKRISILILIASALVFGSCQKVIDIDLNSSDPKLVIECLMIDSAASYTVKLTRTVDYFDGGAVPAVTGAQVVISDDAGNTETLTETQPGVYVTATTQGIPGRTYFLNVTADGKTYSAQSKMPNEVPIDSAYAEYIPPLFGGSGGYVTTGAVQDPINETNYYRQRLFINGEQKDTAGIYFLADDRLSNGQYLVFPLFPIFAELGDTVEIEMYLYDKPAYDYFVSLSELVQQGGPTSASPGNPVTMISGGAMGYFVAAPVVRASFVVQ
jgi:hypothetical protein